ncbi:MAG TPA: T9SS type A sorting domain-containing protein [Hanamia sp.]|nr:T9SS type A sorting domain-containing protein [Hanamia sp.]
MKKICKFLIALIGLSPSLKAQLTNNGANINIQTGAYIFAKGNINNTSGTITNDGKIEVQGDFTNAATYTSSATDDYLVFSGSALSTLKSGGASLTNLTINKTSNDVKLGDNISVGGNLTMQAGNLELNLFNIDLGSGAGAIMNETNDSRITGTSGGNIIKTANLNAPASVNPGNIGIAISSSQNLGSTVIKRGHVQQTSANGGLSIYRYFDITPANNTSLNATLKMYYFDGELAGINKSELQFYSSEDNGNTWALIGEDNNDQANDWVLKNNIDHLSIWTLASKISNPLPIKLLSFTATLVNRTTQLQWITAQEINSSYFEVQRSKDGTSFDKLFSIPAHGNSSSKITYNAVDKNPFDGINYYRLKIVDIDGNFSFSSYVQVNVKEGTSFMVFPNPAAGTFYLHINLQVAKKYVIGLYDVNGRMLQEKEVELNAGGNQIEWNISAFAKGTYFLRSADNSMPVIKVVKQ